MSDNDLVRRGDVLRLFEFSEENRQPAGCRYVEHVQQYCGCEERTEAIRALPAALHRITRAEAAERTASAIRAMAAADHAPRTACPKCWAEFPASAPAERLARAADNMTAVQCAYDEAMSLDGLRAHLSVLGEAQAEFAAALAAYRAAPEPAPMTFPLDDAARRMLACPNCGVDSVRKEPAPEPNTASSDFASCVRAALPGVAVEDGPAKTEPCAGCHGRGVICANPRCNYMVPCGSICNKCGTITLKCGGAKPEPCRTCGGGGWLWRHEHPEYREIPMEDLHDDTRYSCPACRPGGGA